MVAHGARQRTLVVVVVAATWALVTTSAVPLSGVPDAVQEPRRSTSEALADENDAFVEVNLGVDEQAGSPPKIEGLACKCESYACVCKKECTCRIVEGGAAGSSSPLKGASSKAPSPSSKNKMNPTVFKCGCDFAGADFTVSRDEGLDCDCSGAKCTCQKKCVCKPGSQAAVPSGPASSPKTSTSTKTTQPKFREEHLIGGTESEPGAEEHFDEGRMTFD